MVSDGEDDEWKGPPGSLLGSDVLARVSHDSDFNSNAQQSRQELKNVPPNKPKRKEPTTQADRAALARAYKYGQSGTTTKTAQSIRCSKSNLTLMQEFAIQHSTDHYTKFDPDKPYHVQATTAQKPFKKCSIYNYGGYHLCMDPNITSALQVPQLPLRLDDRLVAFVYEGFKSRERHRLWPSEFREDGMVRAGRIPLGFAAKYEYKVGDVDFEGNILQPGEEGWYYLWLGGVHCLMGKEGMDAGHFKLRSSKCGKIKGFAFRKSHKAEIQAPPGLESER